MNKLRYALLALTLACSSAAFATPITDPISYTINQTVGGSTVTGTITTDGALGTLFSYDIIGFNFNISDGNTSATLDSSTDDFYSVLMDALTADSSNLYFNFDGSGQGLAFESNLDSSYFCIGQASTCVSGSGYSVVLAPTYANNFSPASGVQQISGTAATPEPGSLMLVGTGALAAAGSLRRRFVR